MKKLQYTTQWCPTCWRLGLRQAWAGTWCLGYVPKCPSRTWRRYLTTCASLSQVPHCAVADYPALSVDNYSWVGQSTNCAGTSTLLQVPHLCSLGTSLLQVPVAVQCHHALWLIQDPSSPNPSLVCFQFGSQLTVILLQFQIIESWSDQQTWSWFLSRLTLA